MPWTLVVVVKLMEIRDANQGSSCQFVASLYGAKHPSGHQDTCVEIAGALLIAVKLVLGKLRGQVTGCGIGAPRLRVGT